MLTLPIDASLREITDTLRHAPNLVLVAPPGAGKTTRVPPAILRANILSKDHPHIIMLQPRRVAARAAAERIADENGWTLGREVGYHIRFEKRLTPATRIRVLTEGILTRQLLDDPYLEGMGGVGLVILDEFHERNLHTDLALAFLREIQQTVRPDLKLIVMSATLQAEPVAAYLNDAPIIRTQGRVFPVEISHRPSPALPSSTKLEHHIAQLIDDLLNGSALHRSSFNVHHSAATGDILVFLPGVEEIRRTHAEIEKLRIPNLVPIPLHGSLTSEEQHRALRPAPSGQTKIILATNIAETSLTIDGVRTVIDSGLVRIASFDPDRGMDRLDLQRISQASATQRAGRAGRTAPGVCIRLWSAAEDKNLDPFETPEILRVDLAATVLSLHAWGVKDPRTFNWFEKPSENMLAAAEELLTLLGAIAPEKSPSDHEPRTTEHARTITPIGRQMLAFPAHPRIARLLIEAARLGLASEGATIAALLSEKDILRRNADPRSRAARSKSDSDLLVRLEILEHFSRSQTLHDNTIDAAAIRQVLRVRTEFHRLTQDLPPKKSSSSSVPSVSSVVSHEADDLLRLPLFAFPDRVVRRRSSDPTRGLMVGGAGIRLAPESSVLDPELFLALDLRHDDRFRTGEALVSIASGIRREWLEHSFPHALHRDAVVQYDETRHRVVGLSREFYRDLLLREDPNAPVSDEDAARVLAAALAPRAAEIFQADEACATLLARVALLRKAMPEKPWPTFDAPDLARILVEASPGKRSLDDIRRASGGGNNLANLLRSHLPYPLDRLLDEHAPETLTVPTGNRIRIQYDLHQNPILAVRLQELFGGETTGWADTPRIAAGRVPLTLHLLGPNYRPVQVTSDLRSFWKSAYFEVRKDLRARYPKHSWPEDPLTAKPEAKGRRRQQ